MWRDIHHVAIGRYYGISRGVMYKVKDQTGRATSPPIHFTRHTSLFERGCSVQCREILCFYILGKMTSIKLVVCAFAIVCISIRQSMAAPAPAPQEENFPPMPYEYKYDVEDQEKLLFFGANEQGDAQGKVIGGYRVLLPDGRLMNVEYTVEGDSGFVPKITFEDNANPFGKGK